MGFPAGENRRSAKALLAAMALALALASMMVRGGAQTPPAARDSDNSGDGGAGPTPAELVGNWVGVVSHGGETSPVLLELEVAAGGEMRAKWSTPVIHLWDLWDFAAGGSVSSTPAVDAGRVYFGSFDGHVYALAAASGKLLWKHDTGGAVTTAPALFGGRVIIGSRSYDLLALDGATGKPAWTRYYWFSWVESPATIFGGAAYVGSSDAAKLFAFDARTGKRLWEIDAGGSAWAQPAVTDKQVFIGSVGTLNYLVAHRGTILAVDRATGLATWRFAVAAPTAATFVVTEYGFAAAPATGEGLVYFAGLDGRVLAFTQQ